MRKGRRVYDQLTRKYVTGWLGRKEARVVRNTIAALTPNGGQHARWDPAGQYSPRFILTRHKRRKR